MTMDDPVSRKEEPGSSEVIDPAFLFKIWRISGRHRY
jgi:hypothetical protein